MNTVNDENIPICSCHKIRMGWQKKNDRTRGGSWYCKISKIEYQKRYDKSIKGYIRNRKYHLGKRRKEVINQLKELENVN